MKHTKNKKRITDKQYVKDYKGEESPYHQFMSNVIATRDGASKGGAREYEEFPEANPDVLAESDGLWYVQTDLNDEQMEMVIKALPFLTEKQQLVVQMVGYEGKTLENVGAILGISKGNVADLLNRARKIIKDKCKNLS